MITFEYVNWSTKIFQGFYETNLYNCDSLFYLTEQYPDFKMPEGYEWEIDDFSAFEKEVGEKAVELLSDYLDKNIVTKFEFVDIDSPRFYNYRNDKIIANVTVDEEALENYCYFENGEKFANYLKDNFTSYSGFISFVPNKIEEFKEWEDTRKWQVMFEFHLLTKMEEEEARFGDLFYEEELVSFADDCLYERLCLYKDGECFEYSVDEEKKEIFLERKI